MPRPMSVPIWKRSSILTGVPYVIDEFLSDSDVVAKTKSNTTGTINEFVIQVQPMDAGALYPNAGDPLLKTILKINYTGMSIGEIALETVGGGQVTLTGKDGTVTGTHKLSLTTAPTSCGLAKAAL